MTAYAIPSEPAMSLRHLTVALVVAGSWLAGRASTQAVIHDIHGTQTYQNLGFSLDGAGDVNADGFDDFIVGSTDHDGPTGVVAVGAATVYSGFDGTVLYEFLGLAQNEHFGHDVAGAGDVDADGYDDVLASSPFNNANGNRSGIARVYSGLDGSVLHEFKGATADYELGWTVAGLGDVDEDGHDDFAIGETHLGGGGGKVLVYSGADGSVLHALTGETTGFGYRLDGAGDVDADGVPDVIVGTTTSWQRAFVFSGSDGHQIYMFEKPYPEAVWWGSAVAGAGDVNADGHADLLVGAYDDYSFYPGGGMARVLSGADGSELYTFYGWSDLHRLGMAVDGAGDVNADGYDDVVVGVPGAGIPETSEVGGLLLYSGYDGSVIRSFSPHWYLTNDHLGRSVAGAGDLNGDGFADVLGGSPSGDLGAKSGGSAIAVSFRYAVDFVVPPEVTFNQPTTISIHGKGFEPDTPIAVRVAGLPATDVTWISSDEVRATTPVGTEDHLADVEYEQDGQTVILRKGLMLGGARIESLFPPAGSWLGGEDILVLGQNFVDDGSMVVKFVNTPGIVQAVYEPDTILVRTPPFADGGVQVTVESSSGSDTVLQAYLFQDRWVTPRTGGVDGGTLITMKGDVQPTTVADTQAWVGGLPATVVSQTANSITISTPAVAEASGVWQTVLVHNSLGNWDVPKGFYYTPYVSATAAGNAFVGYQLTGAVQSSLSSVSQHITLWLIDPTLPVPTLSASRAQSSSMSTSGTGTSSGASGGSAGVVGAPGGLTQQSRGPAGTLAGCPVTLIMLHEPVSAFHGPWYTQIGAMSPALIGTTVKLQGLVTNGTPPGSYTNVMTLEIQ